MKTPPATAAAPGATADATLYRLACQHAARPFAWGRSDCLLWALEVVRVLSGRDLAADLRGHYASALQARRLLHRLAGAQGLHGLLAARLGPPLPQGTPPQPGDVLLLGADACTGDAQDIGAAAVAWRGGALAQGGGGLRWLPAPQPRAAWRVVP